MKHIVQTFAFYCAFVVVGLAAGSLGPSIPGFAAAAGETVSRTGMLFIFYRIGYVTGSLGGGRVIDAWGGNKLTGGVLLCVSAALILLSFPATLVLLFAVILFLGLALGTSEVCGQTGIIRLHGDKVGPYMNGLHLSYCVGAIISPLLVTAFLREGSGSPAAFRLMAGIAVLTGIVIMRLPGARRLEKTQDVFVKAPLSVIIFLVGVLIFSCAAESSFSGWLYSYALKTNIARESLAGVLTSAFWFSIMFGRLLGVYLVRKLGSLRLLFISVLGAALSMTALLVSGGSLYSLWITVILSGFFQASAIPLVFTYAGEKKIASGPIAGLFISACSIGGMVFPPLLGALMQSSGFRIFPAGVAAVQVLALVSFFCFFLQRKKLG